MVLPIRKFREAVFQMLYSINYEDLDEAIIEEIMDKLHISKKNARLAKERVIDIRNRIFELDKRIKEFSQDYSFDRISKIELTALRLGLYEMLYEKLPQEVVIAEAIRLCKKFGSKEGAKFVHAVLDGVHKGI